jgi:general secretion pathway protein J
MTRPSSLRTSSLRSAEHGFTPPLRSAEHGFTPPLRSAEHGFTLVELLIALSLFALMALLSVALLRSSIDTQNAVSTRLIDGSGVERLRALLASELLVAQPAPTRDAGGAVAAAFSGDTNGIAFTSASDDAVGDQPLRRLRVNRTGDELLITRDGLPPAPLLDGLSDARFRFRMADGSWVDQWPPSRPDALPRAVELVLTPLAGAPLTMRFVVAPGPEDPLS